MPIIKTGLGRYDPDLRDVETVPATAGDPIPFGGFSPPVAGGTVNHQTVGVVGHRHGLFASRHLASLPPAGARGYVSDPDTADLFGPVADYWEPPPPRLPGRVIRTPRLLLVVPSRLAGTADGVQRDDASARLDTLFTDDLAALGVTVCLSGASMARINPLAAAIPTLGVVTTQIYNAVPTGRLYRSEPTLPGDDDLAGGEVMVVELNGDLVSYGGMSNQVAVNVKSAYAVKVFTPPSPVPGAVAFDYAPDPLGAAVSVLAFPASVPVARAEALADRSIKYRHAIFHVNKSGQLAIATGLDRAIDDAGVYATLLPGPPEFVTRTVLPAGDPDLAWGVIRAAILDFFSP